MKNKEHLKKLVQELGSNQTLSQSATLGELVNGLVHDLNNSLAIIWGFSEKIQNNPDSMSESIDKIISHTQKMANLLQNIRLYYKATPNEQASTTTLKDFVEKSLSICQPKLKSLNIYIEHGEIPNINFVCRVSNEIQAFVTKSISTL